MDGNKKVTIVAHSGDFHTDDLFAVSTLLIYLGENANVEILRTRDMSIIEKSDYVVDVGGIDNPDINRFDHHQKGGAGKRENGIKYASFGLVWKKFGKEICGNEKIAKKFDEILVQPIDAPDNGIALMTTTFKDIFPVDLGFLTFIFKPTWKEDVSKTDDVFRSLIPYAKGIILRTINYSKDFIEGQELVEKSYEETEDKRVIVTDSGYPWLEVLSKHPEPLFVVYFNKRDDTWSIKGIRDNYFSFDYRKLLPESWAGKYDGELEKVTGVPGGVFCHNHRFMAVNKTKEGILKMAEIALNS